MLKNQTVNVLVFPFVALVLCSFCLSFTWHLALRLATALLIRSQIISIRISFVFNKLRIIRYCNHHSCSSSGALLRLVCFTNSASQSHSSPIIRLAQSQAIAHSLNSFMPHSSWSFECFKICEPADQPQLSKTSHLLS